jgi:hypothetical protein
VRREKLTNIKAVRAAKARPEPGKNWAGFCSGIKNQIVLVGYKLQSPLELMKTGVYIYISHYDVKRWECEREKDIKNLFIS